MLLFGLTFFIALSAPVKNAVNPAPPPPPPTPSFGTAAVLKIVDTVRNVDIATLVGLKHPPPPPPPPPPPQGFGAVVAQAWEDPGSVIPSSSDLIGAVNYVYDVYKTATIPSTSDVIAALSDIRNVKFTDLRQRFQTPPPPVPPPPSFPSRAWFRGVLIRHAEEPLPPPPPSSLWARFYSYVDLDAAIAKVRGIPPPAPAPPPPPPSRWEWFVGEMQARYVNAIMPHTSYLAFKLGEIRDKVVGVSQGVWSFVNPAAVNATPQAAPTPSPVASDSTVFGLLSWFESVRTHSLSIVLDGVRTVFAYANSPLSGIHVNDLRMKTIEGFRTRLADVMSTSMGMQLFRATAPKGDKVDLSTSGVLDEPTRFTEDPGLRALLQASRLIEEQTPPPGLIKAALCEIIFRIGFALGYAHAYLNGAFPPSRIWKWVQFFYITGLFFVFVFLWNRCVNYWVQLKAERKVVEEEENRRKEIPPRMDSLIDHWTRYTPAQEQAILDGVR